MKKFSISHIDTRIDMFYLFVHIWFMFLYTLLGSFSAACKIDDLTSEFKSHKFNPNYICTKWSTQSYAGLTIYSQIIQVYYKMVLNLP